MYKPGSSDDCKSWGSKRAPSRKSKPLPNQETGTGQAPGNGLLSMGDRKWMDRATMSSVYPTTLKKRLCRIAAGASKNQDWRSGWASMTASKGPILDQGGLVTMHTPVLAAHNGTAEFPKWMKGEVMTLYPSSSQVWTTSPVP
jgi:hypothetical protein